jgi:hypothetical protein
MALTNSTGIRTGFLCPRLPPLLQLCCNSWLEIMAGNHGWKSWIDLPTMPSNARTGRCAHPAD